MSFLLAAATPTAPNIDWAGLSPLLVLLGGAILALIVGLAGSRAIRTQVVPLISLATFGAAIAAVI